MNENIDTNSDISLNFEFSNSLNVRTLAQRLKTNQRTKKSDFDEELVLENINIYLISKQIKKQLFIEMKEKFLDEHPLNYLFFNLKLKYFYKILKKEYQNINIEIKT